MKSVSKTVFTLVFLALILFGHNAQAQVEKAFVTEFENGSLYVINTQTNAVEDRITLGEGASGIVANSNCTLAYVVSFETNALFVIDLTTNSVVDSITIPGPGSSAEIVITPDNSTLYIEGQNGIVVINALTLATITSIPIAGNVQSIAITPDGSKVFTADSNFYYVIETASNTIVDTVAVPGPFDVDTFTVSPDGQTAYLTNFSSLGPGGLIISTATNQITDTLPRPPDSNSPTELGFLPDGSKAYLTDFNEDFISQYDPVSNTFTGNFTIGDFGAFLDYTSDGNFAYIARLGAVTVFNTQSNTVVDNISPVAEGDEFFGVAVCALGAGVAEVPTLSEWGFIVVVSMLGIAGFIAIRRRKAVV